MSLVESVTNRFFAESKKELLNKLRDEKISERVVQAISRVDRSQFTPLASKHKSYYDQVIELPGYETATLSQPSTVALMTDLLNLQEGDRVLEIGTATGYQAAILSELVGKTGFIVSAEVDSYLAKTAYKRLNHLGYKNISVVRVDGTRSFTPPNTFNKLIITTSVVPETLPIYNSIAPGGIIVVPIGGFNGKQHECTLTVVEKEEKGLKIIRSLPGFQFVPSQGVLGWNSYQKMMIMLRHHEFLPHLPFPEFSPE